MLGFGKLGETGTGKVVSCQMSRRGSTNKDMHGATTDMFDVILDVTPDNGASPFRAETRQRFSSVRFPGEGVELKVACDPEKRKVEIDLSEDERFNWKIFRKANREKREQEHDALLNAEPGTEPTWTSDDPDLAELVRLEEEEKRSAGS